MHHPHGDQGLWAERLSGKRFDGRPAVFFDRDGVLVEEVHFLHRPQDVRLVPGVAQALALANAANVAVVVVTNQSGIARGLYGWAEFAAVEEAIRAALGAAGASIDLVLACGYHRDGFGDLARDHDWRKPGCGMIVEAARILGIDLARSLIVGDRLTDIEAGAAAGLAGGILVPTGYGARELARIAEGPHSIGSPQFAFRAEARSVLHGVGDWLASMREAAR